MTQQTEPPIAYCYRPVSYWTTTGLNHLVANVKGAERKTLALRLIKERRLEEADDLALTDCLPEDERRRLGKVHPALMGGEYLPDYREDEIEIARVSMASVTRDVISIRARPESGRIFYRAVDEYRSGFVITPTCSFRPLKLKQLISLIDTGRDGDGNPIGLGIIQCLFDCGEEPADAFADFLRFSSEFTWTSAIITASQRSDGSQKTVIGGSHNKRPDN